MFGLLLSKFETYLFDEEQTTFELLTEQQDQNEQVELFQSDKKEYPAGFFSSL